MVHIIAVTPALSLLGVIPVRLTPSAELLRFLQKQLSTSTIAVEYPAEYPKTINSSGPMEDYLDGGLRYWNTLLEHIEAAGHNAEKIDDISFLETQLRCLERAQELAPRGLQFYRDNRPSTQNSGLVIPAQMQALYRLMVESYHVRVVQRTNFLIDKVTALRPAVAFLSVGVAGELYRRHDNNSLPVESFSRDSPESEADACNSFQRNVIPDIDSALYRTVQRAHNAVTQGRIIPDKVPDFIGTWRTAVPAEGLFEVYVTSRDDGVLRGAIEDSMGSASFTGRIEGDVFEFEKFYDRLALQSGGIQSSIRYLGRRVNSRFEGAYSGENASGEFWLENFTPKITTSFTIPLCE